jgi:hypothetical protein
MSHTSDEQEINSIALTLINEVISSMEKTRGKKQDFIYYRIVWK